ncbi:MAG TPA: histidine kinase dimerization/phospho-acceptor domain-containing protein [Polyangiaceae bacterium]|nr:histidine kinase dimerization/phospho-acceptor domain-containing protein [Polyangiaceae bacterium]
MPNAKARELQARARFEALRRRVFDDMGRTSVRMRLAWIIPFHVVVVVVLAVRGESAGRAFVQAAAVAVVAITFAVRIATNDWRFRVGSFVLGVLGYFAFLATTGGLASPLLVTGAVTMAAAAIKLPEPPWLRQVVFAVFLLGFIALAALSRSAVGLLDGPLAVINGSPSPEYVGIAVLAAAFAMTGVYGIGCAMTRGYERAALELAERREELCSENEDRTRALEGMAARLAHEVKNPLAAIRALSTHMARNATDVKTSERLAIVAAEADRLQSIVEGFLSFSRGLDDLNLSQVNPYEVVEVV